MVQGNEVVMLLLGIGVFIFFWNHFAHEMDCLPNKLLLISSFITMCLAWVFTVLEGLCLPDVLNVLEHSCYAISSLFLCLWCLRLPSRSGSGQR